MTQEELDDEPAKEVANPSARENVQPKARPRRPLAQRATAARSAAWKGLRVQNGFCGPGPNIREN